MNRSITLSEDVIARFWSKVKIGSPDECWEWQAHRNNKGYGVLGIKRDIFLAHRISWAIKFGDLKGKCALHKCDNPACVNPNHLFSGTMKENMDDKMAKGRYKKGITPKGMSNYLAKLKDADIPIIREMCDAGISTHVIGAKFGVTSKTIWAVGKRITWTHIK